MIRLEANKSASQTFYCTPFNNRKDYGTAFTKYLIVFKQDQSTYPIIANVAVDNERYTQVSIVTNTDAQTSGNVKLESTGLYSFAIYGQNSDTNLDPLDSSVVGLLETGSMTVFSSDSVASQPSITIPGYIYYRE